MKSDFQFCECIPFSFPAYSRCVVYIYIYIYIYLYIYMRICIYVCVCFRLDFNYTFMVNRHSAKRPTFVQFAQRFVCVWLPGFKNLRE